MSIPRSGTPRPVPARSLLLRRIGYLATHSEIGELRDAAIFVRGNEIVWVGRDGDLPASIEDEADDVMELDGRVVVPGMAGVVSSHRWSRAACAALHSQAATKGMRGMTEASL
jgi:predicted amidohydrolase YtcJ